ncbi:lipase (class 2) domain-containing protein [Ditylenchus destructor]|nr:lipase (class 2) domain-containing protein [Ditylenchus destructor]
MFVFALQCPGLFAQRALRTAITQKCNMRMCSRRRTSSLHSMAKVLFFLVIFQLVALKISDAYIESNFKTFLASFDEKHAKEVHHIKASSIKGGTSHDWDFWFEGKDKATTLESDGFAADLASFGGFKNEQIYNEITSLPARQREIPIVMLHGVNHGAEKMSRIRKYFLSQQSENKKQIYHEYDIYGFTYGPEGDFVRQKTEGLHCAYVKQIRTFIRAVIAYTKMPTVNIVAYSMGVLLSRKAILGGKCVDEEFDLGNSLTSQINIFTGVSGPNEGSLQCYIPLAAQLMKICNKVDGLHPSSQFITDINKANTSYEGTYVFSLISLLDTRVWFAFQKRCGGFGNACLIQRMNISDIINGHVKVFYKSWDLIYNIIRDPVQAKTICDRDLKKAEITPGVCPRNNISPENAISEESIWNPLTSFLKGLYATDHKTASIKDIDLKAALLKSIENGSLIDETEHD